MEEHGPTSPGERVVRLRPGDLTAVIAEGLTLAETLTQGNTNALPDAVTGWLDSHRDAISASGVEEARQRITEAMGPPPFAPETAVAVGLLVAGLVEVTDPVATALARAEQSIVEGIWGGARPQDDL